jgi:regulator of sirC expression with transglutaminase-like and TPR domain
MDEFVRLLQCPDAQLDLARAALVIARDEYPALQAEPSLRRLDALAAAVRAELAGESGGDEVLAGLDRCLFQVEGFTGDAATYYDPRNSYLNDVLARRRGIPITLSLVYLEVGWRLGLALEPVGFPGHFLIAVAGAHPAVVIDAFNGGQRLSGVELLQRLVPIVGAQAAHSVLSHALAPVPRREVIARILRNLKAIHVQAGDWPRALRVTDRLVALAPAQPAELRDRAQLYEHVEAPAQACRDYSRYLELAPEAADASAVRARLELLRLRVTRPN